MSAWSAMQRIARQMNYTIENVSPRVCKVNLPGGFSYEVFDNKAGTVRPGALLMAIETSGVLSSWPKTGESHLQMNTLLQENIVYAAIVNLRVFPEMYLLDTPKFPLCYKILLKHVGQSSIILECMLSCPDLNTPYAIFEVMHVSVDPITRKPKVLPEWFRKQYGDFERQNKKQLENKYPRRPKSCLCHEVIVHPDDCDNRNHTNFAKYGKFCFEACSIFVRKDLYKNINKKLHENGPMSINISFRKESMEFECLRIYSWDDDSNKNKVYFEVENNNREICCNMSMEFYSEVQEVSLRRLQTLSKL